MRWTEKACLYTNLGIQVFLFRILMQAKASAPLAFGLSC